MPGLALVTSYRRAWLPKDVVAGLVLSALLVPQGMAYADLAGLPPVTGLYTSILCLLGYAVFGPSRILVLGPDSSLGPMIAATILPLMLAGGDPARAVALASLLAVLVGVIMVAAGLAKFGFVADLLSKPTQIGYMNGLALTIIVGQLPKLLGFSVDADGLLAEARGVRVRARAGRGEHHGRRPRGRVARRHPAAEPAAAQASKRPDRRRAGRPRGQRVRPGIARRGHDRRAPAGLPALHGPKGRVERCAAAIGRSARHRRRRARGHHVHGVGVRCPPRRAGARQPGDDRHRCRQHRRRLLPGLSGQHQRVAHGGRGAGRLTVPGHRGRRRRP